MKEIAIRWYPKGAVKKGFQGINYVDYRGETKETCAQASECWFAIYRRTEGGGQVIGNIQ